ncbi:MAG: Stage V sporulation protein K [Pelotomaculum sp. PtaU1.Bin035]|nr:MAG: Stage V sporulation protein K [Pelotomaculum sp. PtaU1.Bin035]
MKVKIWNIEEPRRGKTPNNGLRTKNALVLQTNLKTVHASEELCHHKNAGDIMRELYALVGLHGVKKLIEEIYAFVEIQRLRQKEKLVAEPLVLHMIFKGNPGTGKTTVARILGKLFKEVGVLPKGHLVEVERADLVGEFIGHTAQKAREQIKKALGGILFIDEAYSLARGGEKDFGKEAIDALVKGMEDYRDNLILILAGYQDEMDWFVEVNPGLRSRFPIHISFPDYSNRELLAIADLMLQQRQYVLSGGAREELRFMIEKEHKRHEHSGNARLVRNLIERAIRRQAVRLLQKKGELSRNDLMSIDREDLEGGVD